MYEYSRFLFCFRENNLTPLARVVEYSDAAVNPVDWPVAPAKGIQELLDRAGKLIACFTSFVSL